MKKRQEREILIFRTTKSMESLIKNSLGLSHFIMFAGVSKNQLEVLK